MRPNDRAYELQDYQQKTRTIKHIFKASGWLSGCLSVVAIGAIVTADLPEEYKLPLILLTTAAAAIAPLIPAYKAGQNYASYMQHLRTTHSRNDYRAIRTFYQQHIGENYRDPVARLRLYSIQEYFIGFAFTAPLLLASFSFGTSHKNTNNPYDDDSSKYGSIIVCALMAAVAVPACFLSYCASQSYLDRLNGREPQEADPENPGEEALLAAAAP